MDTLRAAVSIKWHNHEGHRPKATLLQHFTHIKCECARGTKDQWDKWHFLSITGQKQWGDNGTLVQTGVKSEVRSASAGSSGEMSRILLPKLWFCARDSRHPMPSTESWLYLYGTNVEAADTQITSLSNLCPLEANILVLAVNRYTGGTEGLASQPKI